MTALPAAAKLVVMHGHAEPTAATLWIQTDAATTVTVRWRAAGEAVDRTLRLHAAKDDDHVVVARLTGLAPEGAPPTACGQEGTAATALRARSRPGRNPGPPRS